MAKLEQLELDAHRARLASDLKALVDKYRAIFGWDVPDIDEDRPWTAWSRYRRMPRRDRGRHGQPASHGYGWRALEARFRVRISR